MTAWGWLVVASLGCLLGVVLLVIERYRFSAGEGERRRWAARHGWRYDKSDPALPGRWRFGSLRGGGGAVEVVSGRLATARGRRPLVLFDQVRGGRVQCVVLGVRREALPTGVAVEFWSSRVRTRHESDAVLVGSVGNREAYVFGFGPARPLITGEIIGICDSLGEDVPVVWCEDEWVLATTRVSLSPPELEPILRTLGVLADQLDHHVGPTVIDAKISTPGVALPTPEVRTESVTHLRALVPQPRPSRELTTLPRGSDLGLSVRPSPTADITFPV